VTDVLGIDPGLARAAVARIHHTGQVRTWRWTSDPLADGPDGHPPLVDVLDRVWAVRAWAISHATTSTVLAVLEWKAHGVQHAAAEDERATIRLLIARALTRAGVPVAIARPGTMERLLTGHGRPGKDRVREVVAQIHPRQGLAARSHDETDAAGLATLAQIKLAALHVPGWSGPWLDARALAVDHGVQWPALDHLDRQDTSP
jgi:hypothetical protein